MGTPSILGLVLGLTGRSRIPEEARVKIFVDPARWLSVPCDADDRIVFDRRRGMYQLLPASAVELWERIEAGGTFQLDRFDRGPGEPVRLLEEAGLLSVLEGDARQPAGPPTSWRLLDDRA